jgi:hypothetical protein
VDQPADQHESGGERHADPRSESMCLRLWPRTYEGVEEGIMDGVDCKRNRAKKVVKPTLPSIGLNVHGYVNEGWNDDDDTYEAVGRFPSERRACQQQQPDSDHDGRGG